MVALGAGFELDLVVISHGGKTSLVILISHRENQSSDSVASANAISTGNDDPNPRPASDLASEDKLSDDDSVTSSASVDTEAAVITTISKYDGKSTEAAPSQADPHKLWDEEKYFFPPGWMPVTVWKICSKLPHEMEKETAKKNSMDPHTKP